MQATFALLGILLIAAQTIVVVHDAEADAHATDHACEVCVSASVLGSGNVGAVTDFVFVAADRSIEPATRPVFATTPIRPASARAPPTSS